MRLHRTLAILCLVGCAQPDDAAPAFSDAARFLFTTFDGEEADLAFAVRGLETQIYLGMDVDSGSVNDRALLPEFLQPQDVVGLNDEGRDISVALPVSVAGTSPFELSEHAPIQLLADHTAVEPYSPDKYDRIFHEGEDCWESRSCTRLRTTNSIIKENALMTVDSDFHKDFRWIDLSVPHPSEDASDLPTESRWAYVARSWTDQSWPGRKEKTWIRQSYTIEVWLPRDGQGFVRDGNTANVDDGDWTGDSTGGGTLRMLTLWAETELGFAVSDDLTISTTRSGIDRNFRATDEWLAQ